MTVIRLPVPPSVNALYRNVRGRGRVKTRLYRQWIKQADKHLMLQAWDIPNGGKCELMIRLPKIRGDVSNRIKAAEDYLVSRGITADDKHNRKVSVEVDETLTLCEIEVRTA